MRISVLLPLALNQSYDYRAPDGAVSLGQFVRVPLRKKEVIGVVWSLEGDRSLPEAKLRNIIAAIDFLPPLNKELRDFINWVADYTMSSKGLVLKLAMSPPSLFTESKRKAKVKALEILAPKSPLPQWTKPQIKANEAILAAIHKGGFQSILLKGITGSGKTEIGFNAVMEAIKQTGQALFLLPEIALANYMLERFQKYSDLPIAVWHSAMTPAKRRQQWLDIASGKTKIVIGARSALFLPFHKLNLIIVDEEHDEGFKQGEGVIYHARDMAIVRASLGKFPILLSSATPCLETLNNVAQGKCQQITITERAKPLSAPPEIKLIDMRAEKLKANQWLAPQLTDAIKETLARKEQVLLFLNRRGYAPLILCRKCGFRFACPDCTAWLAEHRATKTLLCHHCGIGQAIPEACPQCGEANSLTPCGPGVERIFEEVKKLFPTANTACLSRDIPADVAERTTILDKMKDGSLDILIGTQIIAKGLHFPTLTLAGIVDADLGLANADLRAAERCFQLLQQVAGRTGREGLQGTAFLQTYMPDHNVMAALGAGDEATFIKQEGAARKAGGYPPFGKLAAVILSSENKAHLEAYGAAMKQAATAAAAPAAPTKEIRLLGPAPAPIFRRAKRYRIRFLVQSSGLSLQPFLRSWLKRCPDLPTGVRRAIDIDPHSFL